MELPYSRHRNRQNRVLVAAFTVVTAFAQLIWTPADVLLLTVSGPVHFDRLFMLDDQRGWATGVDGDLASTEDGGAVWRFLPLSAALPKFDTLFFLSPTQGWASSGAAIFTTSNGGQAWTLASSLAPTGVTNIADMNLSPDGNGLAVGAIGQSGVILRTADRGVTWIVQGPSHPAPLRGLIARGDQMWAFGDGLLLRSNDGGATWASAYRNAGQFIGDAAAVANNEVILVGEAGLILHTTDGGVSWQRRPLPAPYTDTYLAAAQFISPRIGWIAGRNGRLFYTDDGGSTWTYEAIVPTSFVRDMAFNGIRLFVAGDDNAIFWRGTQ